MTITNETKKSKIKVWPELTFPLSYEDALGRLTKDELTSIRTHLRVSGLSSLNKQELVKQLADRIPEKLAEDALHAWTLDQWMAIQQVVNRRNRWLNPQIGEQQLDYFRERGILFPGTVDGVRQLIIPTELADWFKSQGERHYNRAIVKRNTEWVRLTAGLLYYCGTITVEQLAEPLASLTGEAVDPAQLLDVLLQNEAYYGQFQWADEGRSRLSHPSVDEPQEIAAEQETRAVYGVYPFTKAQLLQAGEPGRVERSKSHIELVKLLCALYGEEPAEVDLIVQECVQATMNGASLGAILEIVQDSLGLHDQMTMSVIADKLVQLMNGTRQRVLKGYTADELAARKLIAEAEATREVASAGMAEVISIHTRARINRNDPCPCGSGKKFKKCCGN